MAIEADIINGMIEFFGSGFLLLNIIRLIKDKVLKGIHWLPTCFFTVWGFWNLYYYPTLHQWFSFVGGLCVVLVNTAWLFLIWRYRERK